MIFREMGDEGADTQYVHTTNPWRGHPAYCELLFVFTIEQGAKWRMLLGSSTHFVTVASPD